MKKEVRKYIDNFWKYYVEGAYVYTYLPKSYPKGMLTKKDQETIWKEIGQVNSLFNQGIEFKSDPNNKLLLDNLDRMIFLIRAPRLKQKLVSLRTDLIQIKLKLSDESFKSNQLWALGPLNYFKKQLKQRINKLDKEITIPDVDKALLPLRPFLVGKTPFAIYVKKLNKNSEIKNPNRSKLRGIQLVGIF